jgi:hypothetical protein
LKYEAALIETFGRKEDRSKVSLQERPIDIKHIADLFVKKKLNLAPKYQRGFVWTSTRASRLIETVLGKRFVPPIVLHEREGGRYDVVDGKQRLLSLLSFYFGREAEGLGLPAEAVELKLEQPDGEVSPLSGLRFEYLSPDDQDVYGLYLLNSRVIPENADQDLVFAIYQDINSGGQDHTDHQLRRAAYQSEYFELIDSLRSNRHFLRIRNATDVDHLRELDGEMILRAFAFSNREYRGPLWKFLNREAAGFNKQLRDASTAGAAALLAKKRREFEEVVRVMLDVFGPEAVCRKWDPKRGRWETKPSLPLWDSLYNVLREVLLTTRAVSAVDLQRRSDAVRRAMRDKFEGGELDKARGPPYPSTHPRHFPLHPACLQMLCWLMRRGALENLYRRRRELDKARGPPRSLVPLLLSKRHAPLTRSALNLRARHGAGPARLPCSPMSSALVAGTVAECASSARVGAHSARCERRRKQRLGGRG